MADIPFVDPATPYRDFLDVFNLAVQALNGKMDAAYKIKYTDLDVSTDEVKIQLVNLSSAVRAMLGGGGGGGAVFSVNGQFPITDGDVKLKAENIPYVNETFPEIPELKSAIDFLLADTDTGIIRTIAGTETSPILLANLTDPLYYMSGTVQYNGETPQGVIDLGTAKRAVIVHYGVNNVYLFSIYRPNFDCYVFNNTGETRQLIFNWDNLMSGDKDVSVTANHVYEVLPSLSQDPLSITDAVRKGYVDTEIETLKTALQETISEHQRVIDDLGTYKPIEYSGSLSKDGWQPYGSEYVQYFATVPDGYVPGTPYNLPVSAEDQLFGNQIWSINNNGQLGILAKYPITFDFTCSILVQKCDYGNA